MPPRGPRPLRWPGSPDAITRRAIGWTGVAAALIGVFAAAVIVILGSGDGHRPSGAAPQARAHGLVLPPKVAGYVRTQEGTKGMLTSSARIVSGVRTGVYQRRVAAAQPGAGVMPGLIAVDVGRISQVSPAGAIASLYGGVKSQVERVSEGRAVVGPMGSFPSGPLGGEVRCWNVTAPVAGSVGSAGASCLWADDNTFGYLFAPGMRTSSLASALLAFRSVIETPAH